MTPLVLLTSDGYCYSNEHSHVYTASVVGSQFLELYRKARAVSGLKRVLLVLDVHREHAENDHLFGEDGALKHFWFDIACLKLSRKNVPPIWGLEASDIMEYCVRQMLHDVDYGRQPLGHNAAVLVSI